MFFTLELHMIILTENESTFLLRNYMIMYWISNNCKTNAFLVNYNTFGKKWRMN